MSTLYFPAGIILLLALMLAACGAPPRPASVYQGECRVFEDPGFRVRGLRSKDSRWVATTQEVGIQVCGWKRPPPEAEVTCDTVRQAVALFGGDVAQAEAYAVSQGATQAQIATARQCLATTATVVKAPVKKKRVWFSRKTLPPVAPEAAATPVVSKPIVSEPITPVVSKPVFRPKKKCRPHWWRGDKWWQRKACPR